VFVHFFVRVNEFSYPSYYYLRTQVVYQEQGEVVAEFNNPKHSGVLFYFIGVFFPYLLLLVMIDRRL
jgi:hypothetical protein